MAIKKKRTARILVQVPYSLKIQLDEARAKGVSSAGLIRHLLTQHFNQPKTGRKDGHA